MQVVFISMGKIRSRLALAYYALNHLSKIICPEYAAYYFCFKQGTPCTRPFKNTDGSTELQMALPLLIYGR